MFSIFSSDVGGASGRALRRTVRSSEQHEVSTHSVWYDIVRTKLQCHEKVVEIVVVEHVLQGRRGDGISGEIVRSR